MTRNLETQTLAWLDQQAAAMVELVRDWSNLNTGTGNLEGLAGFEPRLEETFGVLGSEVEWMELPDWNWIDHQGVTRPQRLGRALRVRHAPKASHQVWLGIHYDTVYEPEHPFQSCRWLDTGRLNGPGVADAKGGLVVLLYALRAVHQLADQLDLGWEVYLNPDEEIGSPGSSEYFRTRTQAFDFGLLYEPALANGAMAYQRKGSGNFTVVVRGRAAHAGRDHASGRNALIHLAKLVQQIDDLNGAFGETTFNVAKIEGGGPANIVPDLAIGRFNVRVDLPERVVEVQDALAGLVHEYDQLDGYQCELSGGITSPPKVPDARLGILRDCIESIGEEIGEPVSWQTTGGVCDGNKLFAAGVPNIDTLGPRGGRIHSSDEFLDVASLVPRAKLTARLLLAHAQGQIELPPADESGNNTKA